MCGKAQDTSGWKYNRDFPLLSLLPFNWRPNLDLFGPNKTLHLREKGVCTFSILKSPMIITVSVFKNLIGNFICVKLEFSIIRPIII
jgi:hypothetical protein